MNKKFIQSFSNAIHLGLLNFLWKKVFTFTNSCIYDVLMFFMTLSFPSLDYLLLLTFFTAFFFLLSHTFVNVIK